LNEGREAVLLQILNGVMVPDETLARNFTTPPAKIRALAAELCSRLGPGTTFTRKGGLGAHWDYSAIDAAGKEHRIELKCSEKKLSAKEQATLSSRPWSIAVQFLQGQLKSGLAARFLGPCGVPMMKKWFETVIQPFVLEHVASLPDECLEMTEAEYMTAMYDMAAKAKGDKTPGYAFINALRDDEDLAATIKTAWKNFQNRYLRSFKAEAADILAVVKEVIEIKDWWLCITKDDAQLVEGLTVLNVVFQESKLLKDSRVLLYQMTVSPKSRAEPANVLLELRFHWKNGGQGLQNINFLLK
jgi:hypothetical protein